MARPRPAPTPSGWARGFDRLRTVVAAALGATALAAPACEPGLAEQGARRIEGATYVLAWRADQEPKVGEFFGLEVAVCARTGARPAELRVDAQMPEHRHGMNYRPSTASRGDGRFTARGLLLHMPGRWEFSFDVRGAAGAEVLRDRVLLR